LSKARYAEDAMTGRSRRQGGKLRAQAHEERLESVVVDLDELTPVKRLGPPP